MNMQAFYKQLSNKPSQVHKHRLANLMLVSRTQILDTTKAGTWLIWNAEAPIA
ncbi:MAG TPA: hypothetical protein VN653_19995 [Anaerolineales bacterium]|nr:hypothetical protein [Anaerolineales bacterium]